MRRIGIEPWLYKPGLGRWKPEPPFFKWTWRDKRKKEEPEPVKEKEKKLAPVVMPGPAFVMPAPKRRRIIRIRRFPFIEAEASKKPMRRSWRRRYWIQPVLPLRAWF